MIKSDMAEHQIMQSLMRHVAREFASADIIAASVLAASAHQTDADQRAGFQSRSAIDSLLQASQLNYPLALKRGLERFGWQKFRRENQRRPTDRHENPQHDEETQSESCDDEKALNSEDIAVFRAVDQLMPNLQDEGLCTGAQLGLYRAPSTMSSFWSDNLIVVLLPVDGLLGRRQAVFTFLLRSGFEPRTIQGRLAMRSDNPIQPLPHQELEYKGESELVVDSRLVLDQQIIEGKSFLLGMITQLPPALHWLDLDHRDLNQ